MIALADHNLLLIKLNLPSNTPRLRNPVRGSPDLTLAQINAVQCIYIMWMQKGIRAHVFFLTRCRKSSKRRYTILSFFAFVFWLTWQTQEFCVFTVEAKITGVHPEATIMIAAELRGSGSYLDRTMRNGMSFSNQTFAAFLYFCSNIPVLYQEKKCN